MKTVPPEFDRYADKYTALHDASIQISGESSAYFAAYKAKYLAAKLGAAAAASSLSILDFGCGVGNAIPHLRQAFPNSKLHGVDLSGESIRLANESRASEATFTVIQGSAIPCPDQQFDAVMAACVFHHIPQAERAYWMSEIRRVLKPGGQAFIYEHNVMNPLTLKTVRDCAFDKDAILLPRGELLNLARGAKFQRIRCQYIVFFPRILAAFRPIEAAIGWLPLGAQYVVHATAG